MILRISRHEHDMNELSIIYIMNRHCVYKLTVFSQMDTQIALPLDR